MPDDSLVSFIKNALAKGYSEDYVRKGLLAKNWPLDKINEFILIAKSQLLPKREPIKEPEIKIEPLLKPKKHVSAKAISITTLSFIGIFLLLTFTLLVYFYMNGVINYKVIDPTTDKEFKKSCLYQDCHDLRDAALVATKSKLILSIIIGFVTSALIVLVYRLIPYKNIFFWVVNSLYFLFIIIIAFIWLRFANS